MKICSSCKQQKEKVLFHKNKNAKDGLNSRCVECTLEYNRERYRKNKGRAKDYQREYWLKNNRRITLSKYGLTEDDFSDMLKTQGGRCAICEKVPDTILYVDHCHLTGRVRGLLCRACNTSLGNFEDDVARLQKAIDYLSAPMV